jgi:hypothetical protein
MQPMEGPACTQSALIFFLLSFGWGWRILFLFSFVPNMYPMGSLQVPKWVPIRCPMCSPRVCPIAPRFNPICFAQSPPLLTYIGGPKGEALHLSIESSIMGNLHSSIFFVAMGQLNWLIAKKKKRWTCEAPPTN